jgi:hypothetical protein
LVHGRVGVLVLALVLVAFFVISFSFGVVGETVVVASSLPPALIRRAKESQRRSSVAPTVILSRSSGDVSLHRRPRSHG